MPRSFALLTLLAATFSLGQNAREAALSAPVVLYRSVGHNCELAQKATLFAGDRYAALEIEAVVGEVYVLELSEEDHLETARAAPVPLIKLARSMGFEVKTTPAELDGLPKVVERRKNRTHW
jgi:hypothetical protein